MRAEWPRDCAVTTSNNKILLWETSAHKMQPSINPHPTPAQKISDCKVATRVHVSLKDRRNAAEMERVGKQPWRHLVVSHEIAVQRRREDVIGEAIQQLLSRRRRHAAPPLPPLPPAPLGCTPTPHRRRRHRRRRRRRRCGRGGGRGGAVHHGRAARGEEPFHGAREPEKRP